MSAKQRKRPILQILCLLSAILVLSGCQEVADDAVNRAKAAKELGNDFMEDPAGVACDMIDPRGKNKHISEATKEAIKDADESAEKLKEKIREVRKDVEKEVRGVLDLEQETDDSATSDES